MYMIYDVNNIFPILLYFRFNKFRQVSLIIVMKIITIIEIIPINNNTKNNEEKK